MNNPNPQSSMSRRNAPLPQANNNNSADSSRRTSSLQAPHFPLSGSTNTGGERWMLMSTPPRGGRSNTSQQSHTHVSNNNTMHHNPHDQGKKELHCLSTEKDDLSPPPEDTLQSPNTPVRPHLQRRGTPTRHMTESNTPYNNRRQAHWKKAHPTANTSTSPGRTWSHALPPASPPSSSTTGGGAPKLARRWFLCCSGVRTIKACIVVAVLLWTGVAVANYAMMVHHAQEGTLSNHPHDGHVPNFDPSGLHAHHTTYAKPLFEEPQTHHSLHSQDQEKLPLQYFDKHPVQPPSKLRPSLLDPQSIHNTPIDTTIKLPPLPPPLQNPTHASSLSNTTMHIFLSFSNELSQNSNLDFQHLLHTLLPANQNHNHDNLNTFSVYNATPAFQQAYLQSYSHLCYTHPTTSLPTLYHQIYPSYAKLAHQLFAYCAMYLHGGVLLSGEGQLLLLKDLHSLLEPPFEDGVGGKNYYITAHKQSQRQDVRSNAKVLDSFLAVHQPKNQIMGHMVRTLVDILQQTQSAHDLNPPQHHHHHHHPREEEMLLELQQLFHQQIHTLPPLEKEEWMEWKQSCTTTFMEDSDTIEACPPGNSYCCRVLNPNGHVLMLAKLDSAVPFTHSQSPNLAPPLTFLGQEEHAKTTARIVAQPKLTQPQPPIPIPLTKKHVDMSLYTPNFFDILLENDCLPSSTPLCLPCLLDKGRCHDLPPQIQVGVEEGEMVQVELKEEEWRGCALECPCYCASLCHVRPLEKMRKKRFEYLAPLPTATGTALSLSNQAESGGSNDNAPPRWIPRLIHQLFHQTIHRKEYPQLSRVVQSWNKSGWTYTLHRFPRFQPDHDDTQLQNNNENKQDDAEEDAIRPFLKQHFPSEVLEAYDALLPSRFRSDLARYCLLFVYGGVYADVDVMVQVNLENAIGVDVGFMAVVDKTEKKSRNMCLWNGLIASSPGHPFLAQVIQNIVNGVRNRHTSLDYESNMCPNPPRLDVTYEFANLYTTGHCALGAAVNQVLGRHAQEEFVPGEVVLAPGQNATVEIPGRTVILKAKRKDMGDLRFTLVERSILVGTTIRERMLEKLPSENEYDRVKSGTEIHGNVYGREGIYVDQLVAHEEVEFVAMKGSS